MAVESPTYSRGDVSEVPPPSLPEIGKFGCKGRELSKMVIDFQVYNMKSYNIARR